MINFSALNKKHFRSIIFTSLFFVMLTGINTEVDAKQITSNSLPIVTLKKNVEKEKNYWFSSYHFSIKDNKIGIPYAIAYFNGSYHLFYDIEQIADDKAKNVWGHSISPDLLHWKNTKNAIESTKDYDKNGLLAGSAIVDDGILYLMYTGLVKSEDGATAQQEMQNLAMSKDGVNFGKSANNPVIKKAPSFSTFRFSSEEFQNPYVWKVDDKFYALLGTQYTETKDGAFLLYESKDLRNWICSNVTALGQNGEMGNVWENPALLNIDNNDILSLSTKGIKAQGKNYLNKYQSGAFVGKLDYENGQFIQKTPFTLYDYGFDFYAPQFLKNEENKIVYIGYLLMPETETPLKNEKYEGLMSIPRELKLVNDKIKTLPLEDLKVLRKEKIVITPQSFSGTKEFNGLKGDCYEMILTIDMQESNNFSLKVRTSQEQETVISYNKEQETLKLNRDKSGNNLTGERETKTKLINNKLHLHIFVDKSSIEVFANEGDVAMSSRIFPDKNSTGIKFVSDNIVNLEILEFYKLKSTHN